MTGAAAGATVYSVVWIPGTDRLRGRCHCGAEQEAEDPIEMWEWLLGHPAGHTADTASPEPVGPDPGATHVPALERV